MRYLLPLILLAALAPVRPAAAQRADGADPGQGDQICVSVALIWRGSADDIAHIRSTPVPRSFRSLLESGGCEAGSLERDSLVSWHLEFGDEQTTAAALAYLESATEHETTPRGDLLPQLERAYARPAAAPAGDRAAPPDVDPGGRELQIRGLIDRAETYRFLAMQYARAAQFFDSPALLARARLWAEPSLAVQRFLGALPEPGPAGTADDYEMREWADLDMQLAVATAGITRRQEDFAAGWQVFERYWDPNFAIAASEAYEHDDSFCGVGDRTDLVYYSLKVCGEGNFDRRAMTYWRYRALFDSAARAAGIDTSYERRGDRSAETAERLVEKQDMEQSVSTLVRGSFGGASFLSDLHLALGEIQAADAHRELAGTPAGSRNDEAYVKLNAALDELWTAARYVSPPDDPGRFRRIARRYAELYHQARKLRPGREARRDDVQRRAAYFSTVLGRLAAIAVGQPAANGDR